MTARVESAWWVVTDLDGTLLDHSYDWSPAKDLIRQLQQHRIPVIPCTSKTAEEVRGFRAEAGLHDPYICLLYTSPSPRDRQKSRMPSSA